MKVWNLKSFLMENKWWHFWLAFGEQCALRKDVKMKKNYYECYISSFCVACIFRTFWWMSLILLIKLPGFLSLLTLNIQFFVVASCQIASNWPFSYCISPQIFAFWFCFIDSGKFLIYNEDSKLCAQAQNTSSVITAPCDEHNEFQQFRWISAMHLLSMGMKLCLGALAKEDEVAVTLETCNRTNELQQWGCRNETLAIKGNDLFLNYGKGRGKKIRLSKGTGKGSRWKIHGTTHSVCSQHYEGE